MTPEGKTFSLDFSHLDSSDEIMFEANTPLLAVMEALHHTDKSLGMFGDRLLVAPTVKTKLSEHREAVLAYLKGIRARFKKYSFRELTDSGLIDDNGFFLLTISSSELIKLLKLDKIRIESISLTGCICQHKGTVYRYSYDTDASREVKRICLNLNAHRNVSVELEEMDNTYPCLGGSMCAAVSIATVNEIEIATTIFVTNYTGGYRIDEVEYESWRGGKLLIYKDTELKVIRTKEYFIGMYGYQSFRKYVEKRRLVRI